MELLKEFFFALSSFARFKSNKPEKILLMMGTSNEIMDSVFG